MLKIPLKFFYICVLLWIFSPVSQATGYLECHDNSSPAISFVEFESVDLTPQFFGQPPVTVTVKGKLKLPVPDGKKKRCFSSKRKLPAVVILHGSAGVDSRGEFYAQALNAAGIATLEIDMWEARGITGGENRPPLPLATYPDAFAALAFLSTHDNIDPNRIGVLGFSWGAVITMASATELYADEFGGGLRFAAHAAHYPICYAYNIGIPGGEFGENGGAPLTDAPVLIQIGEEDDYDQSSGPCFNLKNNLLSDEQDIVRVNAYEGAFHAWDRLQVPITVEDPFSNLGAGGEVEIRPDVDQAYESRKIVVKFFRRNL